MRGPRPVPCIFPQEFLQDAIDTVRRRTAAVQDVQRFRLVLLLQERPSISHEDAAEIVGLSARQVQRWRRRWAAGDFSIEDYPGRGKKPTFPPVDHAGVIAMTCEAVAETELPISRQSVADLTSRARRALGKPISPSTVWRMLHENAIKPWQYEHWIFPRDPLFAEKAGRVLDLYAGYWEGKQLGLKDYVLSSDEKTSIQARPRRHAEQPPGRCRQRRIETEYKRKGALQYLATWDVHRGIVMGRCERRTGIRPFGRMVTQILEREPYCDADRLFLVVDNGSSHRGKRSVERLHRRDKRIILVHTPVHASWLNQVEIYFSIIQRKVLTPNDFANLNAIRLRLTLYEELTNRQPKPFAWKFTRQELTDWLKRASPHFLAASAS